jgi:sec-independent protein translocase protein TatA
VNGQFHLAIGMPSPQELVPIILILVLFFGAKRLPELARAFGKSITEFKRGRDAGMSEEDAEPSPLSDGDEGGKNA